MRSPIIVSTILSSLSLQFFFFWNSRFMKIIRHEIPVIQDPSLVKVAFKTVKRSIVWPTAVRKLKVFNISEQRSILCLCFFDSPVQIKYRIFCKFCVLEYSVYSVFYNIPCIPLFHRMGSPKYRGGHGIKKIGDQNEIIFCCIHIPLQVLKPWLKGLQLIFRSLDL